MHTVILDAVQVSKGVRDVRIEYSASGFIVLPHQHQQHGNDHCGLIFDYIINHLQVQVHKSVQLPR